MADFRGGPVVKRSPGNAGNASSVPGWGTRIPPALKRLSSEATLESLGAAAGTREATETQHRQLKRGKT